MLNLTRLHLGIAHESQFQGFGITPSRGVMWNASSRYVCTAHSAVASAEWSGMTTCWRIAADSLHSNSAPLTRSGHGFGSGRLNWRPCSATAALEGGYPACVEAAA